MLEKKRPKQSKNYSLINDLAFLITAFFVSIIMLSLSFLKLGLFWGYLLGICYIFLVNKLNWFLVYYQIKNKKRIVYLFFILKSFAFFGLLTLIFYLIFAVNLNTFNITNFTTAGYGNKINLFAFIGGIATHLISIFITEIYGYCQKGG
ncbi:hypothetical protein [Mycoplasma nasistruthionis]|uniref:Uncharacterized protein n=1 Tax=Mycoplasma nasistruthionis TaxID=353852 RepID=A0A4Y6I7T5_9MOLU|nr:hypothetical protein [Mycoplasma nasistruthionis]QCZ36674.1 hypothetical protein FG904_01440 [Mycoplasma nasistruthionis]QDF64968.1 hypothetical protein FIV53_01450 [Mycoplasma nasistruthionis]